MLEGKIIIWKIRKFLWNGQNIQVCEKFRLAEIPSYRKHQVTEIFDAPKILFFIDDYNLGRYREGIDKPEPIVWKTRLRCALNKMPDIRELPEMSRLDISDPYRVYELLPPMHKGMTH